MNFIHLFQVAAPIFFTAFFLSLALTPLAKRAGFFLRIYAIENQRTVHQGKIVRFGGLAIYLAFLLSMTIFMKTDKTINAILIGSFILFLGGVIDDMFDIRPMTKLFFEIAAAIYVLAMGGIELGSIRLPFLVIESRALSLLISFIWIIGVSNAVNLMDGLDGLAAGNSFIMIGVIGFISYFMGREDICILSLLLMGAIAGFLPYNFHPASIFMGDCGALTLGYLIACLSLLGFKSTTFITLIFPIVILFVPLFDTAVAILRRKSQGRSFASADRGHFHHILMYKMGLSHRNTVLLIYGITFLFACNAVLMFFHRKRGLILLMVLVLATWIFIELTGMIHQHFHPLIGCLRKITGHPRKKENAFFEANRIEVPKKASKNE